MADVKKPESKPTTVFSDWDPVEIFVILILLTAIVGFVFNSITHIFSSDISNGDFSFYGIPLYKFKSFFSSLIPLFKLFSFIFSGFLVGFAVVLAQLRNAIMATEKAKLYPGSVSQVVDAPKESFIPMQDPTKERWQKILELVNSESESNWRAAIIDADIILDELLDRLNMPGDTIGEKLKVVEKSDFITLEMAWEAHKARNDIAHGGQAFNLNHREAKHVIALFESVFREFHMI